MKATRAAAALAASILLGAVLAAPAAAEIKIGVTPSLTGPLAFAGEYTKTSMERAVADLNAAGGVLGQQLEIVLVDDQCDADAAVLAAKKLVAEQVAAVFGHICSGAAIPASEVYEAAGIPVFGGVTVNPQFTERGLHYVFRLVEGSDRQAALAADLLATRYRDGPMAIVHDSQVASIGLAADVKKELNQRGLQEALYEELTAEQVEFAELVSRLRRVDAAVLYCACFVQQAGLFVRQVREAGLNIAVVAGNAVDNEEFWVIAGAEAAGATLFTSTPNWTLITETKPLVTRLRETGIDPFPFQFQQYAGLQAWAQAAERAKSARGADVAPILHSERFDTVIGTIGFTEKGEIVGPVGWVWWRWRDGTTWEIVTEDLLAGHLVEKPGQ